MSKQNNVRPSLVYCADRKINFNIKYLKICAQLLGGITSLLLSLEIKASDLTIPSGQTYTDTTNQTYSNGTISAGGTYKVIVPSNASSDLNITFNSGFNNSGTVVIDTIAIEDYFSYSTTNTGAVFTNDGILTINNQCEFGIRGTGTNNSVINLVNSGTFATTRTGTFNNRGTIDSNRGALGIQGIFNNYGSMLSDDGLIQFGTGTFTDYNNSTLDNHIQMVSLDSIIASAQNNILTLSNLDESLGVPPLLNLSGPGTIVITNSVSSNASPSHGYRGNTALINQANLVLAPTAGSTGSTLFQPESLTLSPGTTFSGVGSISSNFTLFLADNLHSYPATLGVVKNQGKLSPGRNDGPYGIMTIGGYTTSSATPGTLNIKLQPSTSGNATSPTTGTDVGVLHMDTLNGTTAPFDVTHTNLTFSPASGTYTEGAVYQIFTTPGIVTGPFLNAQSLSSIGAFEPSLTYTTGSGISMTLNRIVLAPTVGQTLSPAAGSVATSLNTISVVNIPVGSSTAALLSGLRLVPEDKLNETLNRVSPKDSTQASSHQSTTMTTLSSVGQSRSRALRQSANGASRVSAARSSGLALASTSQAAPSRALLALLSSPHAPMDTASGLATTRLGVSQQAEAAMRQSVQQTRGQGGFWGHLMGYTARQKDQSNTTGFRARTVGVMAGGDRRLTPNMFVGLSGGYAQTQMKMNNNSGTNHLHSFLLNLYSTWYQGPLSVDVSLAGSFNIFKLARRLTIPTLPTSDVTSRHNGYDLSPHIGMAYEIPVQQMIIEPFAGVDLIYSHEQSYKEVSALVNQTVKSRNSTLLRTELGASVSHSLTHNDMIITPQLKLSYIYKRPTHTAPTVATFAGATSSYSIQNTNKAVHEISPSLETEVRWKDGLTVAARYTGEFSHAFQSHEMTLRVGKKL